MKHIGALLIYMNMYKILANNDTISEKINSHCYDTNPHLTLRHM